MRSKNGLATPSVLCLALLTIGCDLVQPEGTGKQSLSKEAAARTRFRRSCPYYSAVVGNQAFFVGIKSLDEAGAEPDDVVVLGNGDIFTSTGDVTSDPTTSSKIVAKTATPVYRMSLVPERGSGSSADFRMVRWDVLTSFTRRMPSLGSYDRYLFVAGGSNLDNSLSDVVDVFQPKTGERTTITMSQKRTDLGVAGGAGKVYFVGGYQEDAGGPQCTGSVCNFYSSVIDVWDVATGGMTQLSLTFPRMTSKVIPVGNRIFVISGLGNYNRDLEAGASNTMEIFNVATGEHTWTQIPYGGDVWGKEHFRTVVPLDKKLIFVVSNTDTTDVNIYDTEAERWDVIQAPTRRENFVVSAVGHKLIIAQGGEWDSAAGEFVASTSADVYDIYKHTWNVETNKENNGGGFSVSFENRLAVFVSKTTLVFDDLRSKWFEQ